MVEKTQSTRLQNHRTGTVLIFNIFPPKTPLMEPRIGILYGAETGAVEILIALVDSQSKHTKSLIR
jgi:hypothetical protein